MQALLHSVPPTLKQTVTIPHLQQRLLDTHGEVWVSLLYGHCSFLLGPGVCKVLFVPAWSLFPQSCVSSAAAAKSHQSCQTLCDPVHGCQQAPPSLRFSRPEYCRGCSCKFNGGLMVISSKRAYVIPMSTVPRASALAAVQC